MAKRVLVATDLDGATSSVLEAATAPFVAQPSALALCHVRWEAERFLDSENREAPRADLDADAMARLEAWSAGFLPGHARELIVEANGRPFEGIAHAAMRWHADLIVVGASSNTGFLRRFLDSVADRVVREAAPDVLVARPTSRPGVVLAATDLTDSSAAALAAAASAARSRSARLVVLHVLADSDPADGLSVRNVAGRRAAVMAWIEGALGKSGVPATIEILDGSPASRILERGSALGAELIVVASNGVEGLARVLIGSVAEEVTRKGPCCVLVVRR